MLLNLKKWVYTPKGHLNALKYVLGMGLKYKVILTNVFLYHFLFQSSYTVNFLKHPWGLNKALRISYTRAQP